MSHRGFMGKKRGVDPCAYVPGLYTQAEVDDLINIDGYIPVASAAEFDKMHTGLSETMGGCSIWAGTYTTGRDKNYIQVKDIDLSSITGAFSTTELTGIYDGNELLLSDYSGTGSFIFPRITNGSVKNCRFADITINTSDSFCALIFSITSSTTVTTTINNCRAVNCNITNTGSGGAGGMVGNNGSSFGVVDYCSFQGALSGSGVIGGFCGENIGTVRDSYSDVILSPTSTAIIRIGGFAARNNGTIIRCYSDITMSKTGGGSRHGGFVGDNSFGSNIQECYAIGTISSTGANAVGGFSGRDESGTVISNCYAFVNITSANLNVGGFIGNKRANVTNCYCVGTVSGSGSVGGFVGSSSGGTISDSYWDTTVGPATSAVGTGQTTAQLQTPTTASGIYADWSDLIWDFGTDTEYPELINTP